MRLIALTTDFGFSDPWVGIMKGVIASRAPGVPVVDVTHGVPPQDVLAGALVLQHAAPYFPPGTIHVAVVDPGVGGPRHPVCVDTGAALFVGPDNGLLSLAAPSGSVKRIVHLTDERWLLPKRSTTFHGRDVFAPAAATLATGTPPEALGPEVTDLTRLVIPTPVSDPDGLRGEIIYIDHFGNLVTNVSEAALAAFPRERLSISIADARLGGVATSYEAVAPGDLVAVVNSWGLLEIAVREGSARAALAARVGDRLLVASP